MKRALRILAALVAVAAVVMLVRLAPDARPAIRALAEWLRGAGVLGVVVYVLVFVVANVCFVPGGWIAAVAGFVYGPAVGVLIAAPTNVLAACASFAVGRFLARDRVARWTAKSPRAAAIDEALAVGGLRVVLLLRLSMPHNFLNYGLAVSRVRGRDYVLGTAIGLTPVTCLFTFGGSLAANAQDILNVGRAYLGAWLAPLTLVGLFAFLAAAALLTRATRVALARARLTRPRFSRRC